LEDNREVFQRLKFRWKFVDDDKKSDTFFLWKTILINSLMLFWFLLFLVLYSLWLWCGKLCLYYYKVRA
jgi:hypothetical protein